MQHLNFTLTFSGTVDPSGGDPEVGEGITADKLRQHLEQIVRDIFSNGGVTGDTPATLDEWRHEVVINGEGAATRKGYAVIQEGGTSCEAYLHVSDTEGDAQAFKDDCAEGAYRTSPIEPINLDANGRIDLDDAAALVGLAGARDYE